MGGHYIMSDRDTVDSTHEKLEESLENVGQTQLDRIEEKIDKVLLFASEMNKVVENLTPIIADIESKGIGSLFAMLMKGGKK